MFVEYADDRKAVLGHMAVEQAMSQAGHPHIDPSRLAVFLGTGLSSVTPNELSELLSPFEEWSF